MSENGFVQSLLAQKHLPLPVCRMENYDRIKVLSTVCGFLNGDGGWIIVNGDKIVMDAIQNAIVNEIAPLPLVYVQQDTLDARQVVLITVLKGRSAPYTYLSQYYVIVDNEAVKPDSDTISVLWRNSLSSVSRWEEDSCLQTDGDIIDEDLMQRVYESGLAIGRVRKSDIGLRDTLSDLKLLRSSFISNGAVALFGSDLRSVLPQCRVRIQLMLKGKTSEMYDDNRTINGNIFDALQGTIDYFEQRLPQVSMFYADKTGRYDDFMYPLDVIDEAVSNALIHRDYSDRMDEITVFIYSDKLEITNSGVLPEKIVSGKRNVLPHGSILRNPLMAQIFFIAGKMEKSGRGMMLISSKMKEAGKRLPEWSCSNGKTTLTIYNSVEQLNERAVSFLHKLGTGYRFKRTDYLASLDYSISERTAKNDISVMVGGGWCVLEGKGPAARYVRTAKKLPDIA